MDNNPASHLTTGGIEQPVPAVMYKPLTTVLDASYTQQPPPNSAPGHKALLSSLLIPATELSAFRDFAPEIRQMIWAFAVNDTVPRAILIKDHCERIEVSPEVVDPVTGNVLQHAVRKRNFHLTKASYQYIPSILHATHESRMIALKTYDLAFGPLLADGLAIPFDWAKDTLVFREKSAVKSLLDPVRISPSSVAEDNAREHLKSNLERIVVPELPQAIPPTRTLQREMGPRMAGLAGDWKKLKFIGYFEEHSHLRFRYVSMGVNITFKKPNRNVVQALFQLMGVKKDMGCVVALGDEVWSSTMNVSKLRRIVGARAIAELMETSIKGTGLKMTTIRDAYELTSQGIHEWDRYLMRVSAGYAARHIIPSVLNADRRRRRDPTGLETLPPYTVCLKIE